MAKYDPREDDEVVGTLTDKDGNTTEVLAKRTFGVPTKFTEELGKKIVEEAHDNPSLHSIAQNNNISVHTIYNWIKKGEAGDPTFKSFVFALHRARNEHKARYVGNLEAIANNPKHPQSQKANELLLRRMFPEEFGDQIYVSTMIRKEADGIDLSVLTQEQLRDFKKMISLVKAFNDGEPSNRINMLKNKLDHKKKADETVVEAEPVEDNEDAND